MESIDSLISVLNDVILYNDLNIYTDNINQIKIAYQAFNTSNEYLIVNLINLSMINLQHNVYINSIKISELLNKLNKLLVILEVQHVEQNTYQQIYQFIQYLNSIKNQNYSVQNVQIPIEIQPIPVNNLKFTETSELTYLESPQTHKHNKNKCNRSCWIQYICIVITLFISLTIATGLVIFGGWLYDEFHD